MVYVPVVLQCVKNPKAAKKTLPDMGVSKNNSIPKSSILIEFSIINHLFWGTTILGNTHILMFKTEVSLDFCLADRIPAE